MSRLDGFLKRDAEMCAYSCVLFFRELRFSPVCRPPLPLCHPGGLVELLSGAEVFRVNELQLHDLIGQVAVIGFNWKDTLPVDV